MLPKFERGGPGRPTDSEVALFPKWYAFFESHSHTNAKTVAAWVSKLVASQHGCGLLVLALTPHGRLTLTEDRDALALDPDLLSVCVMPLRVDQAMGFSNLEPEKLGR